MYSIFVKLFLTLLIISYFVHGMEQSIETRLTWRIKAIYHTGGASLIADACFGDQNQIVIAQKDGHWGIYKNKKGDFTVGHGFYSGHVKNIKDFAGRTIQYIFFDSVENNICFGTNVYHTKHMTAQNISILSKKEQAWRKESDFLIINSSLIFFDATSGFAATYHHFGRIILLHHICSSQVSRHYVDSKVEIISHANYNQPKRLCLFSLKIKKKVTISNDYTTNSDVALTNKTNKRKYSKLFSLKNNKFDFICTMDSISHSAFNNEGTLLAYITPEKRAWVHDTSNGSCIKSIDVNDYLSDIFFLSWNENSDESHCDVDIYGKGKGLTPLYVQFNIGNKKEEKQKTLFSVIKEPQIKFNVEQNQKLKVTPKKVTVYELESK